MEKTGQESTDLRARGGECNAFKNVVGHIMQLTSNEKGIQSCTGIRQKSGKEWLTGSGVAVKQKKKKKSEYCLKAVPSRT